MTRNVLMFGKWSDVSLSSASRHDFIDKTAWPPPREEKVPWITATTPLTLILVFASTMPLVWTLWPVSLTSLHFTSFENNSTSRYLVCVSSDATSFALHLFFVVVWLLFDCCLQLLVVVCCCLLFVTHNLRKCHSSVFRFQLSQRFLHSVPHSPKHSSRRLSSSLCLLVHYFYHFCCCSTTLHITLHMTYTHTHIHKLCVSFLPSPSLFLHSFLPSVITFWMCVWLVAHRNVLCYELIVVVFDECRWNHECLSCETAREACWLPARETCPAIHAPENYCRWTPPSLTLSISHTHTHTVSLSH